MVCKGSSLVGMDYTDNIEINFLFVFCTLVNILFLVYSRAGNS